MSKYQEAYDNWAKEYDPIRYYDTYGDDYDTVRLTNPNHVWTESDESGAGTFIGAGLYHINAIGYYVTRKPWTNEHESITIRECK